MKLLIVAALGIFLISACGAQTSSGSSPDVPKPAIEKGADTKIPDAGDDSGK